MSGGMALKEKQLRLRCEELVESLDIPAPSSVEDLCCSLSRRRNRPINLLPLKLPKDGPCGLWVSVKNADYIVYQQQTTPMHRAHIIAHEIGHILREHNPASTSHTLSIPRILLPNLSPKIIQRVRTIEKVLGRTQYSLLEEQEAEIIASFIMLKVASIPAVVDRSSEPEAVTRISRSLGRR
jgi:hypothetical protein